MFSIKSLIPSSAWGKRANGSLFTGREEMRTWRGSPSLSAKGISRAKHTGYRQTRQSGI
jgi:hypothetical protein